MSPKQRFQESKENLSFWGELVTKATFLRGLDVALLQLQQNLPRTDHAETAAANFHRIGGAGMLRDILIGLPEIQKERTPLPDLNLRPVR
jgi:hypothetical protein